MRENCDSCRFFTQLGMEDSGLKSGWKYPVGRCENPKVPEGGWNPNGHPPETPRENMASWNSCYAHKRKTRRKFLGREMRNL